MLVGFCSCLVVCVSTDSSVLSLWRRSGQAYRTKGAAAPKFHAAVKCASAGHNKEMCRNIRPLNNFEPPATSAEVQDAALQYVRKIAGMSKPSKANEAAFQRAVNEVAHATQHLLEELVSTAPPKNREVEAAKARARSANRFATVAQ